MTSHSEFLELEAERDAWQAEREAWQAERDALQSLLRKALEKSSKLLKDNSFHGDYHGFMEPWTSLPGLLKQLCGDQGYGNYKEDENWLDSERREKILAILNVPAVTFRKGDLEACLNNVVGRIGRQIPSLVTALVDAGADVNARDMDFTTHIPFEIACNAGNMECAVLLQGRDAKCGLGLLMYGHDPRYESVPDEALAGGLRWVSVTMSLREKNEGRQQIIDKMTAKQLQSALLQNSAEVGEDEDEVVELLLGELRRRERESAVVADEDMCLQLQRNLVAAHGNPSLAGHWDALLQAALDDRLNTCLFLIGRGLDPSEELKREVPPEPAAEEEQEEQEEAMSAIASYGFFLMEDNHDEDEDGRPVLSPETRDARVAMLIEARLAFVELQRRDACWLRRKDAMLLLIGSGCWPSNVRRREMPQAGRRQQRAKASRKLLLDAVLGIEGLARDIVMRL